MQTLKPTNTGLSQPCHVTVPLSSNPCRVAPSTLAHAARMPHSARAAAVRTPMPTTRARQAYAHPPRFLRPGRPPAASAPDGNPAMQASTRRRPHPARADTAHTPLHATRNRPTGPAHAAAPAAGIPDVGLKGASGPATGERECCLLVLNLVSSTLSCIRRPRPRLLVLDVCGFV